MKKLFLLLFAICIISCSKKDDDQPVINQLPPATQIGANTAGCLVNGQVFLPKGNNNFGPVLSCFYQQDQDGYHFGLSINNKENSNLYKTVQIVTNPSQLIENTTHVLVAKTLDTNNAYISNFAEYNILSFNGDINHNTTIVNTGEIKITRLDTQQKIISGTFWYDAVNQNGEVVQIRDGRFDMHYVN